MRTHILVVLSLVFLMTGCSTADSSNKSWLDGAGGPPAKNPPPKATPTPASIRSEKPTASTTADPSGPTNDVFERRIATNISDRVSESADQMLAICDDLVRYVNKYPTLKKMDRMGCLTQCNNMMALSDEEPIVSQKFKKDKNGKYRFRDACNAVKMVAKAASTLD